MGGAKNTLYEGGINVPLFVMGEGISTDLTLPGTEDIRQISHVDFYDTICDIVGASETQRANPNGTFPRRSMSFADSIGWHEDPLPEREFTLSSMGNVGRDGKQIWRVALVWDHYKLICNSDSNAGDPPNAVPGLDDMLNDILIDLNEYPAGEPFNLLNGAMTVEEVTAYFKMRDRLVDHWPAAVSIDEFNVPEEYTVELYSLNQEYVLVAHIVFENGAYGYDSEEFYDLTIDPGRNNNLVGFYMTTEQAAAYTALNEALTDAFGNGLAAPDVRVMDIPLQYSVVIADGSSEIQGPLAIGHQDVGGDPTEYRALLKFNLSAGELPDGFSIGNVTEAQIIVFFDEDSQLFDPQDPNENDYLERDADTGIIQIYQQTSPWGVNPWTGHGSTELGRFDPPPHIIAIPFTGSEAERVRVLPMPSGTPISFGHNEALLDVVEGWWNNPSTNYGVIVIAEELDNQDGDQNVNFNRQAFLRLTLVRNPL